MCQDWVFHKWVRWNLFLNIRVGIRVRGLHLVLLASGLTWFDIRSVKHPQPGLRPTCSVGWARQPSAEDPFLSGKVRWFGGVVFSRLSSGEKGWIKGCTRGQDVKILRS